jgi:tRNA(fMet)-specific endonuclease VapC
VSYLIDSDWVVDYLKGLEVATALLTRLEPEGLAISIISFGEVLEGIIYSRDRTNHEAGFRRFLRRADVLPLSRLTMSRFASIRGDLRRQGQIIGDMDILIASTAIQSGRVLATRNRRHFDRVPGLQLYEGP